MTPRSARRSQAQRSAITRGQILDAALRCLAELGYAETTTTAVATRAGVSRGAQLHHFPTRAELIAAAVEHLFVNLRDSYQKDFAQLSPDADRVGAALDLLWKSFRDPRLDAVLELYVAGRTDPELRTRMAQVATRHHVHILRLAREYFPEMAGRPEDLEPLLEIVLDTLQGMAIRRALHGDDAAHRRKLELRLSLIKDIARRAIQI